MKWASLAPRVDVDGRIDARSATIGLALMVIHATLAAWSMALLM